MTSNWFSMLMVHMTVLSTVCLVSSVSSSAHLRADIPSIGEDRVIAGGFLRFKGQSRLLARKDLLNNRAITVITGPRQNQQRIADASDRARRLERLKSKVIRLEQILRGKTEDTRPRRIIKETSEPLLRSQKSANSTKGFSVKALTESLENIQAESFTVDDEAENQKQRALRKFDDQEDSTFRRDFDEFIREIN